MNPKGPENPAEPRRELRRLAEQVEWATSFEGLRPLFYRMAEIAKRYPDDPEIQSLAAKLKERIAERGKLLRQSAVAAPERPTESGIGSGIGFKPDEDPRTTQKRAIPFLPRPIKVGARSGAHPVASARRSPLVGVGVALAVSITLIGAFWFFLWRESSAGPISVQFQSSPPGASLRVDGALLGATNATLELPPGAHKIEAVLEGYEPVVSTITIGGNSPRTVNLTLIPRSQTVRIYADFRDGEVLLDGEREGALEDGTLVLPRVSPGEHAIEVVSGSKRAAFSVEIAPGRKPQLIGPIDAKGLLAVVINSAGTRATAYSSSPLKLELDGRPVGTAGPEGLPLPDVRPGEHEIRLGVGASARNLVASFGVSPALTAFLKLDIDAGTLVVLTKEDGVRVFIDGKEQRRTTTAGQLRIPFLDVREYRVSASKDGYRRPPEQRIRVRKGSETRVSFAMEPLPRLASLEIAGALPGTEVSIDGLAVGVVGAGGAFQSQAVAPGRHLVELRKQRYKPVEFTYEFASGEQVHISGGDLAMELALGAIRFELSPPNATATYRRIDQEAGQPIPGPGFPIAAGSYIFSAAADGFLSKSVKVEVMAGETHEVELRLAGLSEPEPVVLGMDGWKDPGRWVGQGGWFVRRGTGGFIPFGVQPVHGKFRFTARVLGGKRLRWAFLYRDESNYLLFELDRKRFYRRQVTSGKTRELLKTGLPVKDPEYYTMSIEVAPGSLSHRVMVDGEWITLDTWVDPNIDFTAGLFGIVTREKREYGFSNFSYTPKR